MIACEKYVPSIRFTGFLILLTFEQYGKLNIICHDRIISTGITITRKTQRRLQMHLQTTNRKMQRCRKMTKTHHPENLASTQNAFSNHHLENPTPTQNALSNHQPEKPTPMQTDKISPPGKSSVEKCIFKPPTGKSNAGAKCKIPPPGKSSVDANCIYKPPPGKSNAEEKCIAKKLRT